MAKIRREDLSQFTAEVLPERSVLGPLLAGPGGGLLGQLAGGGGLSQNLPVLGGGSSASGASAGMAGGMTAGMPAGMPGAMPGAGSGASDGAIGQALASAFGNGG